MTEEGKLKTKIRKELTARGFYFCNVAQGLYGGIAGDPDMVLCLDGDFVGVEFKSEKGKQSVAQEKRQALIERNKGQYVVIHNYAEWVDFCYSRGLYSGKRN